MTEYENWHTVSHSIILIINYLKETQRWKIILTET